MKRLVLGLSASLAVLPFSLAPNLHVQEELSRRELAKLALEVLELGSRAMGEDRSRQLEIFEQLSGVPALSPKEEAKWRKDLLEEWNDLPGLPSEKGDKFYWEEEQRGRYIVGGRRSKPKGLMIGMHGGGVGSGDAGASAGAYSSAASGEEWVAIFPEVLEKTERGWTDSGTEEWLMDLVEQARRSFGVDANHVYFAGHSMGGYGSWTLGAHHADRVAALAPSAGAPSPILDPTTHRIQAIDWGILPSLRNTPMVVYQSIDDPQVPPDVNQFAAVEVDKARERWSGYENYTYWEVDGEGHGFPPGGTAAHLKKIAGFERDPVQLDVLWQPVLDWKRQFYWLFWEEPSIGAIVEGHVDRDANQITVDIEYYSSREPGRGLAVLLDDRLVDLDREVVVLLDGKEAYRGVPERHLDVLFETSTSGDPGRQFSVRIPLQ